MDTHSICVVALDSAQNLQAIKLAKELGLELLEVQASKTFPYQLRLTTQGLELLATHSQGKSILRVDFVKGAMGYRRKRGGGYLEAIAKAVGLKNANQTLRVLDATAGLGRDAFILACLGCHLHLIERSPIIAALLKDGLARAGQEPTLSKIIEERMVFSLGSAHDILKDMALDENRKPDVVYLDPMFPEDNKTALVGVDLRILRDIVGPDPDAEPLLTAALNVAKQRVVVKRPIHAPTLSALKPNFVLLGKRNRYDVYLCQKNN